jgi:hypothetical protein
VNYCLPRNTLTPCIYRLLSGLKFMCICGNPTNDQSTDCLPW